VVTCAHKEVVVKVMVVVVTCISKEVVVTYTHKMEPYVHMAVEVMGMEVVVICTHKEEVVKEMVVVETCTHKVVEEKSKCSYQQQKP